MDERSLPEYSEGAKAFDEGRKGCQNPYPHDSESWWRNEAWQKGYQQAEYDYQNDEWDD
ncbi:MAG: hypothetical protein IT434_00095 [Phycisphaerales bacterium]|jgi:hypothetical protein|nr:hypothetical protein [Phycisphaerales bacterium]